MSLMRRELPSGAVRMRARRQRLGTRLLTSAALAALAVLVLYQLISSVAFWAQVKFDDLRYGYPRSYQVDGYIGYGESNGLPTHFMALNLHRQVVVLVVPGDNPTHVTTLKGPYLYGSDQEYAPVTLRLVDVTADGYPDLVLSVNHQRMVWVDQPHHSAFRPLLPQERATAARILGPQP